MKKTTVFILFIAFLCTGNMLQAQKEQSSTTDANTITVYYFHYSSRCATCLAVENVSEKSLQELYPEKTKNGEIIFLSLNVEEETNQPLAESFKVGGQTLLITRDNKIIKDLTNPAFMYARTKPEKLKAAIRETIDEM